jgi:D-alanyl-D-alanine carboxypeptidase
LLVLVSAVPARAQEADLARAGRAVLEGLVERGVPGASAAIVLSNGDSTSWVAGLASIEDERAVDADTRMLSGSVGKTYVTAAAHLLVQEGELELDRTAASYFEGADAEWIERLPAGREATLRQLLQHTSGIPRYVFEPAFTVRLRAEPDKVWRPEELLTHVYDREPLFRPGEGWAYADTNYIVVGLVIERVTGEAFYDFVRARLLEPHGLEPIPTDRRDVPDMAQGYVVTARELAGGEHALEDGRFAFNVQFEWCGGGWANRSIDLARWVGLLYGGGAFDRPYLETLLAGVDAPMLGPGVRYGLGAMLRDTPAGRLVYHDGFMPGYLTSAGYFPERGIAVALQVNTDDARKLGRPPALILAELALLMTDDE